MRLFLLFLLLWLLSFPIFSGDIYCKETPKSEILSKNLANQTSTRVLLPIYIRLQALQPGSVVLWEAVPQNFSDYVGTVDVRDLAILVSSNAQTINLSRDGVGNLWVAINYTFVEGDYISSLMWVSSETVNENLAIPTFVSFPQSYPPNVTSFLNSGRKLPVENETIKEIALNNKTQNMIDTVQNVLNFVNETQEYDRATVELLMSGSLNTTNILDFFEDPLKVMETQSSICIERSLYAATILRAAGVPARTLTDIRLRTWIQVWLPGCGWVDAEAECAPQRNQARTLFPRSLSVYAPWVIENSSDAAFPFTWLPQTSMRVANLTFSDVELFDINEYRTVLSELIDAELFRKDPTKFSFPLVFKPETVYAAVTQEGSNLTFSLLKENENASKMLTLGESNSITLGDLVVSFKPIRQENFLILQDFAVGEVWKFDVRFLVPIVGVPIVAVAVWLYWKKRKHGR